MKFKNLLFTSAVLLFNTLSCFSQDNVYHSLSIGDIVTDVPTFKNLNNYPVRNLSIKDLRGKLVILDFWSTGCPSCIRLMPHMEQLQKEFGDKIQIILINPWESKEKIDQRVSKMKILRPGIGLTTLPNVYGDTIWRIIFPHVDLPHHVWIDKTGKVIATTNADNATAEHIQQILDGTDPKMSIKKDLDTRGYDVRKKGLIHGDTSLRIAFLSGFFKANHGFGAGSQTIIDTVHNLFRLDIYNTSIIPMFGKAYSSSFKGTGRILVQVKNRQNYYKPDNNNELDKWFDENLFSYEIVLPLQQKDSIYSYMKSDLNRFSAIQKNIQGKIEIIKYPSYVLKRLNDNILKKQRTGEKDTIIEIASSYKYVTKPFALITRYLKDNIEDLSNSLAFVDETNINKQAKVSIELPKDVKDKKNLRVMLRKQGLDIELEDRNIEVLVIKDIETKTK